MSDDKLQKEVEKISLADTKADSATKITSTKKVIKEEIIVAKEGVSQALETLLEPSNTSTTEAPTEESKEEDATGHTTIDNNSSETENDETDEVPSSKEEKDEDEDEETDDLTAEAEEKDYHSFTKEELISAFELLLKNKSVQEIKNEVEEIKTEFNSKFRNELEQKKEEFLAEGGNIIDFYYSTPLKKKFNSIFFDYKEKRNNHYKTLKKDLQANFNKRQELIEELKSLLNVEESINSTYKHFKDIQERWHLAGSIPKDKYNIIWNTYHHHVENFYDFLHLNREFRDLDFKHNLEQKLKLIGRAEELSLSDNINKAFRELQMLHKMWKEEIGPVAKEYRDDVWEKFSKATKVIHDRRLENIKEQEKDFEINYNLKKELISKIQEVTQAVKPNHRAWQNSIQEVQKLRETYFQLGKVPRANNKEVWNLFKEATRNFNIEKNHFYKNQKKEQYTNLDKKKELIKIAQEHKDSDDFKATTTIMKSIQNDWKKIGHVPRKDSDKVWKEFKEACNHYFDRLHAQSAEANKEEMQHYEDKNKILLELISLTLEGDNKKDLKLIMGKVKSWKDIGRVPYSKRNIERKFNSVLDGLFKKLNLDKKETELIKFENKLNTMISQEDDKKLQNEQFFITKKIEESKNEIRQLENNLGFFRHVDSNNPLVMDVHNNIAKQKEQLDVWKAKLTKIKSIP